MVKDSDIPLKSLQVDGGMTMNNLLMQLQTDLLGIVVGKCSLLKWKYNIVVEFLMGLYVFATTLVVSFLSCLPRVQ